MNYQSFANIANTTEHCEKQWEIHTIPTLLGMWKHLGNAGTFGKCWHILEYWQYCNILGIWEYAGSGGPMLENAEKPENAEKTQKPGKVVK